MRKICTAIAAACLMAGVSYPLASVAQAQTASASALPVIQAELTAPPNVPAPITRTTPAKVVVHLLAKEVTKEIADGVNYKFWTFDGTVPGSFIRVREGDTVELHLKSAPDSTLPHNIDLHAVMGPGGGAGATVVNKGEEKVFTFKAMRAGLYVYHCAAPGMVAMHIAQGMYGLIQVDPPEGLSKVDREYYVMQGDFYTTGRDGQNPQEFSYDKMVNEQPTYVLFNGRKGALMGDHALQSKVGEKVRLFVGNGGPNLVSSFHVIGQIFDKVWDGSDKQFETNVQTTLVPAGGAKVVELTTEVPGTYLLVDHSISRAFVKGALGQLVVTGAPNPAIFTAGAAK